MTDPVFQQTEHLAISSHLAAKEENIIGLLLRSGHTEFLSKLEGFNARWVVGNDADGTPVSIATREVIGFYLLDRSAMPGPIPHYEPQSGMSAELEAWQGALMELRAAAEESKDERVLAAAARLARLEDQS